MMLLLLLIPMHMMILSILSLLLLLATLCCLCCSRCLLPAANSDVNVDDGVVSTIAIVVVGLDIIVAALPLMWLRRQLHR